MRVVDFLRPDMVIGDLRSGSKVSVLEEMARHLSKGNPGLEVGPLKKVLEERELLASTAIGDGIAIPHGKIDALPKLIGLLGRSVGGLEFDSIDGKPTHLVFMLVAPSTSTGSHLKALARLSRLFRDSLLRQRLIEAPDARAMFDLLCEEDAKF